MKNKKIDHLKKASVRGESRTLLSACLYGAGVSALCAIALAAVCALICLWAKDPAALFGVLGYPIGFVVFLLGGYVSARKKGAALPCGLLTGCIITLASLGLAHLLPSAQNAPVAAIQIILRVCLVLTCILGAIFGANGITKRNKRKIHKK